MTVQTIDPAEVATTTGQQMIPTPSEAITAAIEQWVGGLDVAVRGAEYVVDTPGCPNSFWPLPPGVKEWEIPDRNPKVQLPNEDRESYLRRRRVAVNTVGFVVRYGLGLGLAPEVALTGIFVISGRPSMYAEQMVALIKSRGHEHEVVERTPSKCVVKVRPKGEIDWQHFQFTLEEAITAGYVKGRGPNANSKKGNDKYNTDPAAMLYARATSIACKTVFPHVLRGMVTYEEMLDEQRAAEPVPGIVTATATDVRTVRQVTAADILDDDDQDQITSTDTAEAEGEPPADQLRPDASAPVQAAAPEALGKRQWRTINDRLREIGVTGIGQDKARLEVMGRIVGRHVERGSELTYDEGQLVIDNLAGEPGITAVWDAIGPSRPGGGFNFVGELGERLAREQGGAAAEGVAASGDAAPAVPGDEQEPAGWETGGDQS